MDCSGKGSSVIAGGRMNTTQLIGSLMIIGVLLPPVPNSDWIDFLFAIIGVSCVVFGSEKYGRKRKIK